MGTVSLYRRTPGELSEADHFAASELAWEVAPAAVQRAMTLAGIDEPHIAMAAEMRREVHQATGMVLVQLESTAAIAFSRLQAFAFADGRTLLDVARDVVARDLSFRDLPE